MRLANLGRSPEGARLRHEACPCLSQRRLRKAHAAAVLNGHPGPAWRVNPCTRYLIWACSGIACQQASRRPAAAARGSPAVPRCPAPRKAPLCPVCPQAAPGPGRPEGPAQLGFPG
jgi:hypothetical protein